MGVTFSTLTFEGGVGEGEGEGVGKQEEEKKGKEIGGEKLRVSFFTLTSWSLRYVSLISHGILDLLHLFLKNYEG